MSALLDLSTWILIFIFQMAWLFASAGVANMSASLSKRINFLNIPIDINSFGENKTVRGFFFGFIGSLFFVFIQKILSDNIPFIMENSIINYSYMSQNSIIWFAALSSFGALGGDLIKSYFKRKKNIAPGEPWFPFDQIDWIVGVNLALLLFCSEYTNSSLDIGINSWIVIFPVSVLIAIPTHKAVNMIAYRIGLQKNKE